MRMVRTTNKSTEVRITNIIAKTHLVPPFSLSKFSAEFPFSGGNPLQRIYLPYKNINFSIFRNGAIISRSSSSLSALDSSFAWLGSILNQFSLEMSANYEILNIVSTIGIAPPLNLCSLVQYLPNSSYDPSPILTELKREFFVDAVVHYLAPSEKPRRTALIFSTGNVVLTGFNSFVDLGHYSVKLAEKLAQIADEHPEVIK